MAILSYNDPVLGFVPVVSDGLPIGAIINFPGGVPVPEGWVICDGRTHGSTALEAVIGSATTPDLQDRFAVGAGSTMPAKSTGGARTVLLTGAQMGVQVHNHTVTVASDNVNHTHTYTTASSGGHTHGGTYVSNFVIAANMSNTQNNQWIGENKNKSYLDTDPGGGHAHPNNNSGNQSTAHSHTVTVNSIAAANATEAHNNEPPYYAMVYIVRAA